MNRAKLAINLTALDEAECEKLLAEYSRFADVELAWTLKNLCFESWTNNPARALGAASALKILAKTQLIEEISAIAAWTGGIAALINGRMNEAIVCLDEARQKFVEIGQENNAAATDVSKLYALTMLGRYDEALACGIEARRAFIAAEDFPAAGRIEHNLGNLLRRCDRYDEAETFLRVARERFIAAADHEKLAQIENSLAYVLSFRHKFREAEQLYREALAHSEKAELTVTQAEIESGLGYLALFRGRFDVALEYLEKSRRKFAALEMPHESTVAEQEMADAYLELNLAPEAAAIYERITPLLEKLEMPAERARALAFHGRARLLLGQTDEARQLLGEARRVFAECHSESGASMTAVIEAQAHLAAGDFQNALDSAAQAEISLKKIGIHGKRLQAGFLRGETLRRLMRFAEAQRVLLETLRETEKHSVPQIALHCLNSLGLIAAAEKNTAEAEDFFKQSIELIEKMRAPLPSEDFRTSFFADKLQPFGELALLCLADENECRAGEAFEYLEKARSRSLFEIFGGAAGRFQPNNDFEAEKSARLDELREELNWFYNLINRPNAAPNRDAAQIKFLQEEISSRENELVEITRQLNFYGSFNQKYEQLNIENLQKKLGSETVLIEYAVLNGEILAFIINEKNIEAVRRVSTEREIVELSRKLRFQMESLRHGSRRIRSHLDVLTERTKVYLGKLYDALLRPLESKIEGRRLIIAPHRSLHYIPFHALFDGEKYLVQRREISYTPSAGILQKCMEIAPRPLKRALLFGVPDEFTPRVSDEINALAPLFDEARAFVGDAATLTALKENSANADVLHLACHGQFRPDNPLFSSLKLADGWLTVRDVYKLDLNCELVVLSACETGVSAVSPGDELIGLFRGFAAAGVPSLILSLWAVDDEATALLMQTFYRELQTEKTPAAALRESQRQIMREFPHPFFWASFINIGRW